MSDPENKVQPAAFTVAIVGGGAAAFFAAVACAEANPAARIVIFERASTFLGKVRISGGGRCNVTHACFENRQMAENYPRGQKMMIPLLHRFSTADTIEWFRQRGVELKTEADGRMFPTTDSSKTIIDCFLREAEKLRMVTRTKADVRSVRVRSDGSFELTLPNELASCDKLLIATGGSRAPGSVQMLTALGHRVLPPVPSLFALHISSDWLRALAGVSARAEVSVPGTRLRERGPMLITHQGLSGPAILRLSAWGARTLHEKEYEFRLSVNWLPGCREEELLSEFKSLRETSPNRRVTNSPIEPIPARLWSELAQQAGIGADTRWTVLTKDQARSLAAHIFKTEFQVNGKSLNKDEFVTCGGVDLREVDLRTMQSRLHPKLFFAGEVLDIDGITGGFNFQAAWTTGWIAGRSMAGLNEDNAEKQASA